MGETGRSNPDDVISVIEDLDPEPAPGRRGGLRLDLLAGIPLLLLVTGVALFQWWRQDYQSSQYSAGQEASGRSDLESALHYFVEASGYKDANVIANNMRQQIAERNRLYDAAVEFAGQDKWLHVLRDVREVAKIQPGYKDIYERESEALDHVYTGALSGTVVLRESADSPGLYLRDEKGWVWLKGSDAYSNLLGVGGGGQLIYDVAAGEPGGPDSGTRNRIVRVMLSDGSAVEIPLTPVDVSSVTPIIAGNDGFWYVEVGSSNFDREANIVMGARNESSAYYQPYSIEVGSAVQVTATKPISTGNVIAAYDLSSNRYLVAGWTGGGGRGPLPETELTLYLCAAGEDTKIPVLIVRGGGIQGAVFSPDGRYLVVHTYKVSEVDGSLVNEVTTRLIDLWNGYRTRTLSITTKHSDQNSGQQQTVSAGFIRRGVFAGKLIIIDNAIGAASEGSPAGTATIRLLAPALVMGATTEENYLPTATIEGVDAGSWDMLEQDAEGILLNADGSYDPRSQTFNKSMLVRLNAGDGQAEVYRELGDAATYLNMARTLDRSIAWDALDFQGSLQNEPVQAVYRNQRAGTGAQDAENAKPSRVYTASSTSETGEGTIPLMRVFYRMHLGDEIIAYTLDGNLHVHAYDEDLDMIIEGGVQAIWSYRRTNWDEDRLR